MEAPTGRISGRTIPSAPANASPAVDTVILAPALLRHIGEVILIACRKLSRSSSEPAFSTTTVSERHQPDAGNLLSEFVVIFHWTCAEAAAGSTAKISANRARCRAGSSA